MNKYAQDQQEIIGLINKLGKDKLLKCLDHYNVYGTRLLTSKQLLDWYRKENEHDIHVRARKRKEK